MFQLPGQVRCLQMDLSSEKKTIHKESTKQDVSLLCSHLVC